jgi:hypothetical protein
MKINIFDSSPDELGERVLGLECLLLYKSPNRVDRTFSKPKLSVDIDGLTVIKNRIYLT